MSCNRNSIHVRFMVFKCLQSVCNSGTSWDFFPEQPSMWSETALDSVKFKTGQKLYCAWGPPATSRMISSRASSRIGINGSNFKRSLVQKIWSIYLDTNVVTFMTGTTAMLWNYRPTTCTRVHSGYPKSVHRRWYPLQTTTATGFLGINDNNDNTIIYNIYHIKNVFEIGNGIGISIIELNHQAHQYHML